ncbi:hypothetical protein PI124_g18369 [Phytophthora idaei]|nr:hypothetical protein PI125_g19060 [Phytophthora idaei]KAG3141725.1 hypothetical protein PI126_g15357 [Phytophthora idaei]KAG3236633.1 hypothetical protein PI124_g18369 [Phytophthora idaei]
MVRVPESSGDSGFHRESQEDVQVKFEPGEEVSSEIGSTMMQLNEPRSADRQSAGRNFVDGREGGTDPDLEEKHLNPPQVPSGTLADIDLCEDPLTNEGKLKVKRYALADSPVKPTPYLYSNPLVEKSNEKQMITKTTRKKLKAPGSQEEVQTRSRSEWSQKGLEFVYRHKTLRDFLYQDLS